MRSRRQSRLRRWATIEEDGVDAKVEKGTDKGNRKGQDKAKPIGGNGAWVRNAHSKGGKSPSQANEEQEPSQYTSYTSREHQRGVLKQKEEWDRQRRNDDSNWEWSDYEHKYMWIGHEPERERESPYEECSATLLGFGGFKGLIYGEIPTETPARNIILFFRTSP